MPQAYSQQPIGTPFIELQSVDSTNNYALARLHEGLAQHGAAFFAHEQVAGKGQRGKIWQSERDSNLILSVVVRPHPLLLTQQFQFSALAALSACQLFQKYAGENTSIKWPNDLYWQDRKAGGILIENIVGGLQSAVGSSQSTVYSRQSTVGSPQSEGGNWQWAVIGMGININQTSFSDQLKNPVSLQQITGRKWDTIVLAQELCGIIESNLTNLMQKGFENIYNQYIGNLYKKGEKVKFRQQTRTFEAIVKTVSRSGTLVLQRAMEEEFEWGEIEWLIGK